MELARTSRNARNRQLSLRRFSALPNFFLQLEFLASGDLFEEGGVLFRGVCAHVAQEGAKAV